MEALTSSQAERELSADTILELLANRRRRYLLYALRGREDPIELSTLAETVAGWEHDVPPDEVAKNEYKSVYVSSVQCHVPKLDDAGVVDHDEDNHTVVLADNFDQLEPYLRIVVRMNRRTRRSTLLSRLSRATACSDRSGRTSPASNSNDRGACRAVRSVVQSAGSGPSRSCSETANPLIGFLFISARARSRLGVRVAIRNEVRHSPDVAPA